MLVYMKEMQMGNDVFDALGVVPCAVQCVFVHV